MPHGSAEYSSCLVFCRGSNSEAFDRNIRACLVTPSFETILPSPSSSQSSAHRLCDGGSSLEQPSVHLWDHSSVALNNSWLLLKWLIHANHIKELPVHILHVLIFPIIDKLRIFQIFNFCLNICLMIPSLNLFSSHILSSQENPSCTFNSLLRNSFRLIPNFLSSTFHRLCQSLWLCGSQ